MVIAQQIDVHCPRCGKKLAQRSGGVLEVVVKGRKVRVYDARLVVLGCPCGQNLDMVIGSGSIGDSRLK